MQPKALRSSWNEPEAVFVFQQGSPSHSDAASAEQPPTAVHIARQTSSRPALRVRRPGSAAATAPASGPTAAATPPQDPVPQVAPPAVEQPVPVPFMFGTPGAGPNGSGMKARRPKTRTPASAGPAPSPAFTTSSAASMAWSPYPASSSAEASTAWGHEVTLEVPGTDTPTSGPAPPAAQQAPASSPGPAAVAEDLRSRLNLNGASSSSRSEEDSFTEALRQQLHLDRQESGPAPSAPQPPATAGPNPSRSFSFMFGAAAAAATAALSPSKAGRAAFRKKSPRKSPNSSPTTVQTPSTASPVPAAAEPSLQSTSRPMGGSPFRSADSQATTAAGPAAMNGTAAAPAAATSLAAAAHPIEGFVFGASSASPASASPVQRARQRRHQHRSPSQASPVAAARGASASQTPPPASQATAAPAARAAGTAATGPEPLRENQPQQQPQAQSWFVRVGELCKQMGGAAASSHFATSGTSARRPRRKAVHSARTSPGNKAAAAKQVQSTVPPAARTTSAVPPASPPPATAGPASPARTGSDWNAATQAAYSSSEMYRSQGNEAFRDGEYDAAYDLYTKALHSLWPHPPLHQRLALLLSNRAAALLSQGKPLSALADCQMGLKYDPGLMRCALRVGTCHARMGDFDEAFACVAPLRAAAAGDEEKMADWAAKYKDLQEQERQMYGALRSIGHSIPAPQRDPDTGVRLERSASTGGGISRASSSTAPATAEELWEALKKVDDVAPHVPHAELLLAAKAEGLLRLGRLEKARDFCEQPVHLDEGPHLDQQKNAPWRLWVQAQCSWQEGDTSGSLKQELRSLLAVLLKQEQDQGAAGGSSDAAAAGQAAATSAFFPSSSEPAATAGPCSKQEQRRREQLAQLVGLPSSADVNSLLKSLEKADKLRLAGNTAIKAGKAAEAVQKYTEALAVGSLSPTIAAVLLSNRAAAHQHLKHRAQAVADCCRAVALNPHYAKANSRLATLLAELGYYSDAVDALEAAVTAKGVSSSDKREYQQRLTTEKAAARRMTQRGGLGSQLAIDHYKLLGLERSVTNEDVRRAYKKLALQLHPDKAANACRVAQRCCGCGSLAFEAAEVPKRLQERATWLFKLLGEASEVLCDASKRRDLDHSLAMAASGSSRSFGGFGNYSSYYQDDDDEADTSYFGGMFGRRYGGYGGSTHGGFGSYAYSGGTGYGGGSSYGGYGSRAYGGGYGRHWGF